MRENVNNIVEMIHSVSSSSIYSKYMLKMINNLVFCSLAKIDHTIYKNNLYSFILGIINDFGIIDHKNCRLGKWYYEGDGYKNFRDTQGYRNLEKYHSNVHSHANSIAVPLKEQQNITKDSIDKNIIGVEDCARGIASEIDNMLAESNEKLLKEKDVECQKIAQ
ncbi:CZB domain-containing protein [Helicobacter didelphidarum]